MDPRFEPYFRARVEQRYAGVVPPVFIRADAELMLQLAFRELAAEPLAAVRKQEVDLLEVIEGDVRTITEATLPLTKPEGISSHDIVNDTSRSCAGLRTASLTCGMERLQRL